MVIDPYWESPVAVDNVFGGEPKRTNMWDVTHGDDQYLWAERHIRKKSKAKYKFVFAHHVMGNRRGGIELAGLWEWGGKNAKGVNEFATQRPRWNLPIHQLMVANKVTIFFLGTTTFGSTNSSMVSPIKVSPSQLIPTTRCGIPMLI